MRTSLQGVSELDNGMATGMFGWYRFGPYGLVDYTNNALCFKTSIPYGESIDELGNPEGYSEQTFCPIPKCIVRPPKQPYTVFKNLRYQPLVMAVGDDMMIQWDYDRGKNFPETVLLSIFFASDYYEEYPEFIIGNVPAEPGKYTFTVPNSLATFIMTSTAAIGTFPYRLYLQLTFPPQTFTVGGVIAKGNLTVYPERPAPATAEQSASSKSVQPTVIARTATISPALQLPTTGPTPLRIPPTATSPLMTATPTVRLQRRAGWWKVSISTFEQPE
ncbi:hypothetical protein HK104_000969 [Borealophlyctis nickersoniae]|nr:hypothetical protein HK104_000969 [Borealophlyctis nickersoniae]